MTVDLCNISSGRTFCHRTENTNRKRDPFFKISYQLLFSTFCIDLVSRIDELKIT